MVPKEQVLEERVGSLEKRVDKGFEEVDKRFGRVEGDIRELRGDVKALDEKLSRKFDHLTWLLIGSVVSVLISEHVF